MAKIVIAYIPVFHVGYKKLIESDKDIQTLYLWPVGLIPEDEYLKKEIRALEPELMKKSLSVLYPDLEIKILTADLLPEVIDFPGQIIMPDDDISHLLADKYLSNNKKIFSNIFLRWDRRNSVRENKVAADQTISESEFARKMTALAAETAEKSSDWWRHVGAVIVKDGQILLTGYNHHVPSEHMPYIDGDPRNAFHKGENLELSTAIHAEAGLIAEASRRGLSLEGAEIYVTTFPCPPCAKLIAYSGIKKIFYREGYGVLDGEGILKSKGVEIYFVR